MVLMFSMRCNVPLTYSRGSQNNYTHRYGVLHTFSPLPYAQCTMYTMLPSRLQSAWRAIQLATHKTWRLFQSEHQEQGPRQRSWHLIHVHIDKWFLEHHYFNRNWLISHYIRRSLATLALTYIHTCFISSPNASCFDTILYLWYRFLQVMVNGWNYI